MCRDNLGIVRGQQASVPLTAGAIQGCQPPGAYAKDGYPLLIGTAGQTVAELAAPHGHGPSCREAERSGYGHRNLVALGARRGVLQWLELLMHYARMVKILEAFERVEPGMMDSLHEDQRALF